MAYVPLIALLAKATVVRVNFNIGKRIKISSHEERTNKNNAITTGEPDGARLRRGRSLQAAIQFGFARTRMPLLTAPGFCLRQKRLCRPSGPDQ